MDNQNCDAFLLCHSGRSYSARCNCCVRADVALDSGITSLNTFKRIWGQRSASSLAPRSRARTAEDDIKKARFRHDPKLVRGLAYTDLYYVKTCVAGVAYDTSWMLSERRKKLSVVAQEPIDCCNIQHLRVYHNKWRSSEQAGRSHPRFYGISTPPRCT
jgi:hypothetical protein